MTQHSGMDSAVDQLTEQMIQQEMENERLARKKEFEEAFEAWQWRVGNIFDKMEKSAAEAEAEEDAMMGVRRKQDKKRRKEVKLSAEAEKQRAIDDANDTTYSSLEEARMSMQAGMEYMLDQLDFDTQDEAKQLVAVRASLEKAMTSLDPNEMPKEPEYPAEWFKADMDEVEGEVNKDRERQLESLENFGDTIQAFTAHLRRQELLRQGLLRRSL